MSLLKIKTILFMVKIFPMLVFNFMISYVFDEMITLEVLACWSVITDPTDTSIV
jgi:hypothetical protein